MPSCQRRSQRGKGLHQRVEQMALVVGVPARERTPGFAIPSGAEVPAGEHRIARDAGITSVERGVAALELGVAPAEAERLEVERAKRRARAPEREEPGANIVNEAGPGAFLRAESTARAAAGAPPEPARENRAAQARRPPPVHSDRTRSRSRPDPASPRAPECSPRSAPGSMRDGGSCVCRRWHASFHRRTGLLLSAESVIAVGVDPGTLRLGWGVVARAAQPAVPRRPRRDRARCS